MLLTEVCTFMADWDWDVTLAEGGVLHVLHKGLLHLLRTRLWWHTWAILRQLADLFDIVSGVIPACCAINVIHKKRPSCLWVNFNFPSWG